MWPRGPASWQLAGVLLVALVGCVAADTTAAPSPPRISAPDVDPLDGKFTESVHIVMVQNAEHSKTYFTTDGTTPTINSTRYTAPFDIYKVGKVTVRAIAISDTAGRFDSVETVRTYIITEGSSLPEISPRPDTVRGSVTVSITPANAQYKTDLDATWRQYTEPFVIAAPGHRRVYARKLTSAESQDTQTVVTSDYVITPPLRYDVNSLCATCGFQPTRCFRFTVWLQGLQGGGSMFLTTSTRGCQEESHILDDTGVVHVDARQASYRFHSAADPGNVYVCLKEGINGVYKQMMKRGGSAPGPFQFHEAPANETCATLPPTEAPTAAPPIENLAAVPQEQDSFLSIGNVVMWTLIACVVFIGMRAHRMRQSNNSEWQRVVRAPSPRE